MKVAKLTATSILALVACVGAWVAYSHTYRKVDDLRVTGLQPVSVYVPAEHLEGALVVKLSSDIDLLALAKSGDYNVYASISYCASAQKSEQRIAVEEILMNGKPVDIYRGGVAGSLNPAPFTYEVLLTRKISPRDIIEAGQDICIVVRGGNMLGAKFDSNTVVISNARMAASLH